MKTRQKYNLKILLISYLVILVVPLVIGNLDYFLSTRIIQDEVLRSNSAILEQARYYIDKQLNQEKLLVMDIELNPDINEFINVHGQVSEADQYKLYKIVQNLSAEKNKYTFISDFYIYFKNSRRIVTSSSVSSPELFYNYINCFEGMDYEQWQKTILNEFYNNTYTATRRKLQPPHTSYLTYIYSLPDSSKDNVKANLVVMIDENNIKSLLGDLKWLNNGLIYIADENGGCIIKNDSPLSANDLMKIPLEGDEGYRVVNTGEGSMALSYISSEEQNWKYVSLMPLDIYMERVSNIKNISLVVFLISLAAGLITAALLTYKNYSPIKKILKEDDRILAMLEEQKPIIKDNMIQDLLKGKMDYKKASSVKDMDSFGINLPFGYFAVAVLAHDRQEIFSNDQAKQWGLAKLKISSRLIEISPDMGIKAYTTETDRENLVLLLNIDSRNKDKALNILNNTINEVMNFIKDYVKIYCTIGVGSIYDSGTGISKSYLEAVRAIDYRMLQEYGSAIRYDDIVENDQIYYFPIETEQQLANYLKAGDLANAKRIFEYVFEENVSKRHLSPDMLKLLFSNVVGTVVKVIINEIKTDYKSVFRDDFNPTTCLKDCITTKDVEYRFMTIFKNLCAFINENKKSHNQLLSEKIIQYIQNEFSNPDLSLQLIASVFNISVPYLSRFFKEQNGENLNSYINSLRIAKAEELLKNTGITIGDVLREVGFNNESSFIRVFKKTTGVTPGVYKQRRVN